MNLTRLRHRSVELVDHSKERALDYTRATKRFLYQLMQRAQSANRMLDIDGSSRIEQPGEDRNVSAPAQMDAWRVVASRNLAIVFVFSIFVNLLMLTLPIYLFQLSDRVLTSHSIETLLMLTGLALGFHWRPLSARHIAPTNPGAARNETGGPARRRGPDQHRE